jgi:hypothetical protein
MQDEQRRNQRAAEETENAIRNERMERSPSDGGFITDVGFTNPNSPTDLQGVDALQTEGGVGALDPGAGGDIAGDDQAHEQSIVSNPDLPDADRRAPDDRSSGGSTTSW